MVVQQKAFECFFPYILFLSGARAIKNEKFHIEDVQGLRHYL